MRILKLFDFLMLNDQLKQTTNRKYCFCVLKVALADKLLHTKINRQHTSIEKKDDFVNDGANIKPA